MVDQNNISIAVIGYGRFGKLLSTHISTWYPVRVFSASGRKPVSSNIHLVDLKTALTSDYIFLTIPIHSFQEWMKKYAGMIPETSTLIDCASVKLKVIEWILPYVKQHGFHFIATHPLFGPDSASDGLKNHTIVVIPQKIPYRNLYFLRELFEKKLGLQVLTMSAEEHDQMMAYNLSLVHLIGRTLDAMNIHNLPLKMPNLDGLLHIATIAANDSFDLFIDMNKWNPYAKEVRDNFLKALEEIVRNYLDNNF
jgi:prephenate dehydrogenase